MKWHTAGNYYTVLAGCFSLCFGFSPHKSTHAPTNTVCNLTPSPSSPRLIDSFSRSLVCSFVQFLSPAGWGDHFGTHRAARAAEKNESDDSTTVQQHYGGLGGRGSGSVWGA